jgi:hypothetical protein
MGGIALADELGFSFELAPTPEPEAWDPETFPASEVCAVFASGAPSFFRPTPESLLFTLFNIVACV